ncbi:hypothetical protein SGUI_2259 [Serinicoccus hydrothermalis]|uniref:PH domain-containing protein n=1 Tax=Serinicoccus hydrothermalis TaxID=1758689 RepID=A0A1B1NE74_9MICO|nr:hypothetical protein [Serinicoccus hydrothermalis]ANS79655.1 hypothetical protein SGUI_2259 [Serinicoccus hydrothermalis]
MPSVRILPSRLQLWGQVALWVIILAAPVARIPDSWPEGGPWAVFDVVAAVGSASILVWLLSGALVITADPNGLHRTILRGRRLIPWTEITEVRPAPGRPDRIVFRGEDGRTVVSGPMPDEREVDQLRTWHRAALEPARPGDAPDETGSEAQ